MLSIWSLVPLLFINPAWASGSSWFTYCWSLAWRILSIALLVCEMSAIVWYFEHSLALPFFGIGWKLTFSSPETTAECSKFAGILNAALSKHHLRIWNSSAVIPSHSLAIFIVMLPKAHLTSHSRMSGSRWVITPSWLFGSWSCILFFVFCIVLLCILVTSS